MVPSTGERILAPVDGSRPGTVAGGPGGSGQGTGGDFLWLRDGTLHADLPPVEQALKEPNGLLAVGGDLSEATLLRAYRQGVFPWFEDDQLPAWWSPDPRAVLFPERVKVTRSLAKRIRNGGFTVTADNAFGAVVRGCAAPRREGAGTWITGAMENAYNRLHRQGFAHSVEVWFGEELVGGLYGVALGRVFFGESMFTRRRDASKVALVTLARQLRRWNFACIDCQVENPHLSSLGATTLPRSEFVALLRQQVGATSSPSEGWLFDDDL